ncbi:MAG: hypothetical protein NT070_14060 [Cyanobacteria bacterium]|nr:hypothetical protein [Cyanobacteriota bacterium]
MSNGFYTTNRGTIAGGIKTLTECKTKSKLDNNVLSDRASSDCAYLLPELAPIPNPTVSEADGSTETSVSQ